MERTSNGGSTTTIAVADANKFTALNERLNKHTDICYQLVLATLVAAGTFLGLALQQNRYLSPIYVLLALLLGAAWAENQTKYDSVKARLNELEGDNPSPHVTERRPRDWPTTIRYELHPRALLRRLQPIGTRGLFVVTQLAAVFVYIIKGDETPLIKWTDPLVIAQGLAMLLTLLLVFAHHSYPDN